MCFIFILEADLTFNFLSIKDDEISLFLIILLHFILIGFDSSLLFSFIFKKLEVELVLNNSIFVLEFFLFLLYLKG